MKTSKKTAKRNARFKRMTKAEQRVAIAKDALAWAEAGALIPTEQFYVMPEERKEHSWVEMNCQARDAVIGKCHTCALGGLLIAKAVRFDAVTLRDLLNCDNSGLLDHFSAKQINLIEAAFEGCSYPVLNGTDYNVEAELPEWKQRYPVAKDRFCAIMLNIIANRGTFKP